MIKNNTMKLWFNFFYNFSTDFEAEDVMFEQIRGVPETPPLPEQVNEHVQSHSKTDGGGQQAVGQAVVEKEGNEAEEEPAEGT